VLGSKTPQWPTTLAMLRSFLALTVGADNPHSLPAMEAPPTITTSASSDPALSVAYRWTTTPTAFNYRGGGVQNYATVFRRFPVITIAGTGGNLSDGTEGVTWRVGFVANASKVGLRVLGADLTGYRIIVGGQYVGFTETLTATDSGTNLIFADFGSKAARTIIIEGSRGLAFEGVFAAPGDTVVPVPISTPRMVILGDSITSCAGTISAGDGYGLVAADYLGLEDAFLSGSGSTGYVNSASGTRFKLADRIVTDLDRAKASGRVDIIVFAMGINDQFESGVQAQAELCFKIARSKCPEAVIFVLSPWDALAPDPQIAAYTAVKTAIVAAMGTRPGFYFIDAEGVTYTKDAGPHPDDPGHATLGVWLETQIRAAIAA
jgi:hypothetical protein